VISLKWCMCVDGCLCVYGSISRGRMWLCTTKTPDCHDLKLGTVVPVVLDAMSPPTDFGFQGAGVRVTLRVGLGMGLGLELRFRMWGLELGLELSLGLRFMV